MLGKTMENLRNRRYIDLVKSPEKLRKLVKQPSFRQVTNFNEDLAAVERVKFQLYLNRPIYTGFSVLDMSKVLMYQFHY